MQRITSNAARRLSKPNDLHRRCFRCLSYSHRRKDCRDPIVCWSCRQVGHVLSQCHSRRGLPSSRTAVSPSYSSMEMAPALSSSLALDPPSSSAITPSPTSILRPPPPWSLSSAAAPPPLTCTTPAPRPECPSLPHQHHPTHARLPPMAQASL